MALWNDLGRRASDTKAKAVQQAKVLAETTRLNGVIAEEKRKVDEYYHALGKRYAQQHSEDYEAVFADIMIAIATAEGTIRESQEQIRDMKGVQCCANCGAELAKDAAFCSSCGAAIPKPKAPEGKICGNCGAVLMEEMRFCTSCGKPVEQKLAMETVVEEAPAVPENVCPNCKAELAEGVLFCINCGTRIK